MKEFKPIKKINGEITDIAADKSISHRCAIFSLLAGKPCEVKNFLHAQDTLNTLKISQNLGLEVVNKDSKTMLFIPKKEGILEPKNMLDCGNAGTAMRLFTGLLASTKGYFVLCGDEYLHARPMQRVIEPLKSIGACIFAREDNKFAPISIVGQKLEGFDYTSNIASAQIKSAMLLAGLFAKDVCKFEEPFLSRDHTEKMLKNMGVNLKIEGKKITLFPLEKKLDSFSVEIPADPSSAFFFAVMALILPDSHLVLKNILLNPTRIEAFEVLKKMGGKITYENIKEDLDISGDIVVKSSSLRAIVLEEKIAWLIDELPALGIAMAFAEGKSVVKNAKELRVKETDRIKAVVSNLQKMGIEAYEFEDGFSIVGGEAKPAILESFGDHRIAMSFAIICSVYGGSVRDFDCVNISFPNFLEILNKVVENGN